MCLHAHMKYKKAVPSQRWPRDEPYLWVHGKFSGLPDYAHGYFPKNFSWAFVPIHLMNVRTKFEARSFTRSWDNRGYSKKLGSSWIHPRSLLYRLFLCALVFQQFSIGGLDGEWRTSNLERRIGSREWYRLKQRWWVPIGHPGLFLYLYAFRDIDRRTDCHSI